MVLSSLLAFLKFWNLAQDSFCAIIAKDESVMIEKEQEENYDKDRHYFWISGSRKNNIN